MRAHAIPRARHKTCIETTLLNIPAGWLLLFNEHRGGALFPHAISRASRNPVLDDLKAGYYTYQIAKLMEIPLFV